MIKILVGGWLVLNTSADFLKDIDDVDIFSNSLESYIKNPILNKSENT